MRARVVVRRKSGVLDPHGEAVRQTLSSMEFSGVNRVRIGKIIDIELDDSAYAGLGQAEVKARLEKMADELLANPVMETFTVELDTEASS